MKIIFFVFLVSSTSHASQYLKKYCDDMGGKVAPKFQCPKSKLKLNWNFCLSRDNQGRELFFDGCTGPSGGHTNLLYPACIKHDYCYHHEPATNGYTRADCDRQFLANALDLCTSANDQAKCRNWANLMYKALRGFGTLAFNCANYEAQYED